MCTKILKIYGILSGACVDRIRPALSSVGGIENATVSLLRSKVIVECDERRAANADISLALLNAGYIPCDVQNYYY
jgi:copper chaperone CopZ